MRAALTLALGLAVLCAAPAQARRSRARDPRTAGMGRRCKTNSECSHRAQVCLHESDANGKLLDRGFCALPCAALDFGLGKKGEAMPQAAQDKPPPPRCPKRFECRTAGAGVPIDLCVRQ